MPISDPGNLIPVASCKHFRNTKLLIQLNGGLESASNKHL